MKKVTILLCVILLLSGFVACGDNSSSSDSGKTKLTGEKVFNKLKEKEANNMADIVVVDANNDSSGLFGKPNQYYEKYEWKDKRIERSQTVSSIEVFDTAEEATARKKYIENISNIMPMFVQYVEQKDNILLRIEGGLKPDQADEYIKLFKSM